jgi:starch synthase
MKILMVASEASPFLRTSDVANVVRELSLQLRRQDHDARLIVPYYRNVRLAESEAPRQVLEEIVVPLGLYNRNATIWRVEHRFDSRAPLPVYLVENSFYFGRENPYGYQDDYERFIFFTRAVLKMLEHPGFAAESWLPDVLHGHDWMAGLIPVWLRRLSGDLTAPPAFVYTIHNAGFPGQFGRRAAELAELESLGTYEEIGESANSVNFMARGIWAADAVNTVSPTHAEELKTGIYASGLTKAIRAREGLIEGILNGLDDSLYDPSDLALKFSAANLDRRAANKKALQENCGFPQNAEVPLLGVVSRLIEEKGMGLLERALPALVESEEVQVVLLGSVGDSHYQEVFARLEKAHPRKVKALFELDPVKAREIYSGSDLILIPALYEPCGLQQMIAMRYGAVPVVRRTGGLADTVAPWNSSGDGGRGFVFEGSEPECLLGAIHKALTEFRTNKRTWQTQQRHNMRVDFSWEHPTAQYVNLYKKALAACPSRRPLPNGKYFPADRGEMLLHAVLYANELASAAGNRREYLKQAARNALQSLNCDAVIIWDSDYRSPQLLQFGEISVGREHKPLSQEIRSALEGHVLHPEQGSRVWSWQYVYRLGQPGAGLGRQLGFLASGPARKQGWSVQLTVPLTARGRMLGRIDAFLCDPKRDFTEWDTSALSTLASIVASNLNQMQLNERFLALQETACRMAKAEQVRDVIKEILMHGKEGIGADAALLRLNEDECFWLDESNEVKQAEPQARWSNDYASIITESLPHDFGSDDSKIELLKRRACGFSRDDESGLKSLAKLAATSLTTAQKRHAADGRRVKQWQELASSFVGGNNLDELLGQVVRTAMEVLEARAASLYLINENKRLVIKAAAGYHQPLLEAHLAKKEDVSYALGEGTTGSIAAMGITFRATKPGELHRKSPWLGKFKHLQGDYEPQAYLGIPLKIQSNVIGVLKFEDKKEPNEDAAFTDEDVQLAEMMANVIAAVVYNTQASDTRLRQLSANVESLSRSLAGAREMRELMAQVVKTIARVIGADASSLYLIDEATNELMIRAAVGYQEALVERRAKYRMGEGITGWIAETGRSFRANSLEELKKHSAWKGKQNSGQGNREPQAFLGLPLRVVDRVTGKEKVIGVLKVEDIVRTSGHPEPYFTDQDELLVTMMANVIAAVVYNTQASDTRLRQLSANLESLSRSLVGGREMRELMAQVVKTIARVIGADASSLYLIDEATNELMIQAAVGYQEALVERRAKYRMGEGITGWIAETGRSFRANSLEELKKHSAWKGKQNSGQGDREPQAFLGLPLRVVDRVTGKEKVIGVLKIEDIVRTSGHPEPYFTDQDELLVTMMANVIATVVHNTQTGQEQLIQLGDNLQQLSKALAGGRDMRQVVGQVVKTTAQVMGAEASSLYLVDEATQELVIQAATGYQEALVAQRATYKLKPPEGITGWIAQEGKLFRADNLEELHRHPAWKGKQNPGQGGKEPQSFLGVPLKVVDPAGPHGKVIGVLKAEDIVSSVRHPEKHFTEQDVLLVTMMANIIATVIQNTRHGEARLGGFLAEMGLLSEPLSAVPALLRRCASSEDPGVIDQLALTLAHRLDQHPNQTGKELAALFEAKANIDLYRRVSNWATQPRVRWESALYRAVLGEQRSFDRWEQAEQLAAPWLRLRDSATEPAAFQEAAQAIIASLAKTAGLKIERPITDAWGDWAGAVLSAGGLFGQDVALLPVAFRRGDIAESEDSPGISNFVSSALKGVSDVFVLVDWQNAWPAKLVDAARLEARQLSTEMVLARLPEIVSLLSSREGGRQLRRLVLRQTRAVSPFVTHGAVRDLMFFGRDPQLHEIVRKLQAGSSCAMIGGRRVGKSSILRRLHEVWIPNRPFRSVYFDCSELSFESGELLEAFQAAAVRDWSPGPPPSAPTTFGDLVKSVATQDKVDKKLVLLLDEADKLVPKPGSPDWKLFDHLRSLTASRRASVVLSGEHALWRALSNADHASFNLGSPLVLGPLTREEVQMLVERPITDAEIQLADDGIVPTIYELTGGHPNVVQRLCHRLFLRIGQADVRRLTLEDVEAVVAEPEFQLKDYLETYWESASTLEKYLSLLFIDCPHLRHLEDVRAELKSRLGGQQPGPDTVLDALDALVNLRLILKKSHEGYEFAVPGFPRVIRGTISLSEQLSVLEHELVSDGSSFGGDES